MNRWVGHRPIGDPGGSHHRRHPAKAPGTSTRLTRRRGRPPTRPATHRTPARPRVTHASMSAPSNRRGSTERYIRRRSRPHHRMPHHCQRRIGARGSGQLHYYALLDRTEAIPRSLSSSSARSTRSMRNSTTRTLRKARTRPRAVQRRRRRSGPRCARLAMNGRWRSTDQPWSQLPCPSSPQSPPRPEHVALGTAAGYDLGHWAGVTHTRTIDVSD